MARRKTQSRATPPIIDPNERVLSTRELLEKVPLHRATVYRMVDEGRFPPPIRLTRSRIGWRLSSVLGWLAQREAHPEERRAFFVKREDTPVSDDTSTTPP